MKVSQIQSQNFRNTQAQQQAKEPKKREFIDKLMGVVQNQQDVNDCVAVPRGIFKAYLWIMGGFGLIGIANALPQKWKVAKSTLAIVGNTMNVISAFFFAKPFAFKGVSPDAKMEDYNRK